MFDLFPSRAPKKPERDTERARLVDMVHAFDTLGPLAREAIRESPIDLSVGMMLNEAPMELIDIERGGWLDAKLAEWIKRQIARKMGRPAETFVLRPRRVMTLRR